MRLRIPHSLIIVLGALLLLSRESAQRSSSQAKNAEASGQDILAYISESWHKLTRSTADCASLTDPKLAGVNPSPVYLPWNMPSPPDVKALQIECNVKI
ncbi:MAG TPA: trehalase, partial [Terriglobia bacterium]|nr:trehalase [Terriglobia bacterium]